MPNCLKTSIISRSLAVLLAWLIATPLPAQTPIPATAPTQINIVILEGEGAINVVRQRAARETMVQVEDQNHKPVAAAAVTFFLPNDGASGVLANGSRSMTVLTDAEGKATLHIVRVNNVRGRMQIHVQASFQGLTTSAVINQTNMLGAVASSGGAAAGGGISGKLLAILLIGAAGAAAGGFVIANNNSGGGTKTLTTVNATVVTAGTPSVGPPK
jgi:hypothetical protein